MDLDILYVAIEFVFLTTKNLNDVIRMISIFFGGIGWTCWTWVSIHMAIDFLSQIDEYLILIKKKSCKSI
jgi:hypothetical protein